MATRSSQMPLGLALITVAVLLGSVRATCIEGIPAPPADISLPNVFQYSGVTSLQTASSASEYVSRLGVGLNVASAEFWKSRRLHDGQIFSDVKAMGFGHVRIRAGTDVNSDVLRPDGVNPEGGDLLLFDLKTVVDDAIANNLYPIIAYHAFDLEDAPCDDEALVEAAMLKFFAWWKTVAVAFKNYPNFLAFNLIVEVTDKLSRRYSLINEAYKMALKMIHRKTANRIIIGGAAKISEPRMLPELDLPSFGSPNGPFLVAEWHDFAAGPVLYKWPWAVKNPTNVDLDNIPMEKNFKSNRFWDENPGDDVVNKMVYRAKNRQRIRETLAVVKRWQNIHDGFPVWIGAWMSNNWNWIVNKAVGYDYTVAEQKVFTNFCSYEFQKAGWTHAWNQLDKFYDSACREWISSEQNDVLATIMSPQPETGFEEELLSAADATISNGKYVVSTKASHTLLSHELHPTQDSQGRWSGKFTLFAPTPAEIPEEVWWSSFDDEGRELDVKPIHNEVEIPAGEMLPYTFKRFYTDARYMRLVIFVSTGKTYVYEFETVDNSETGFVPVAQELQDEC